jgi:hypothetical protein
LKKNPKLTANANISATIMAHQIPFKPKKIGNISTHKHSKIKVRKRAMVADIRPLFNAVKNPEA